VIGYDAGMESDIEESGGPAQVRLRELLRVFGLIGISSFGGGLSGWLYREVVETRRWLTEVEFFAALSLARTMPGTNVVNLSIWIGYRLRRGAGAATAVCGVLAGPLVLIILVAMLYQHWGQSLALHRALLGLVAAAVALSLSMGLKALRVTAGSPFYAGVVLLTFIGVGVLHWPMLPIVAVLIPASVAWAFIMDER
jgi:chromate transporter